MPNEEEIIIQDLKVLVAVITFKVKIVVDGRKVFEDNCTLRKQYLDYYVDPINKRAIELYRQQENIIPSKVIILNKQNKVIEAHEVLHIHEILKYCKKNDYYFKSTKNKKDRAFVMRNWRQLRASFDI